MSKKQVSKRQALREQRRRKERQKRLITIVVIVGVALLLIGVVIAPTLREAVTPVGEFVQITPLARSNPHGTAAGDPDAPVRIEIFEDFKCSACASFTENIEPIVHEEIVANGQAYYVFHQYPFLDDQSAIKESDQAANASMCAAEQERFWDYHDMLFTNMNGVVGEFSNKRLVAFADSLGLDMVEFENCFDENRYREEINQDIATGDQMAVTGTPSVFVNGEQITPGYVPTYDQIKSAVDAALAAPVD